MSPESMPRETGSMFKIETPVSLRPSAMACWIGAGPRYCGKRDACTFNLRPGSKRLSIGTGIMRPKEAVIKILFGS